MPITNAARAAAYKAIREKKLRKAELARGIEQYDEDKTPGVISATPAAYISSHKHVPDYAYVPDEVGDLAQQAQSRLMWGHRGMCREPPFLESLLLYEHALAKAKPPKPPKPQPTEFEQRMHDIRRGRASYPPAPSRRLMLMRMRMRSSHPPASSTKVSLESPSTLSRRRKMKNRSREERLADLQAALRKQGKETT